MNVLIQVRFRKRQRSRGARPRETGIVGGAKSALRLALTVLMFLGTMTGGLEIGNAIWTYSTVVRAAELGARYAELHSATDGAGSSSRESVTREIENIVRDNVGNLNGEGLAIDTTWSEGGEPGDAVRVRVAYSQRFFASSLTFAGEGLGIPTPQYQVAVTN